MATITRTAKLGGGTNFNSGQLIDPTEVNTDFNQVYTEINGLLDDGNIETATIPGAKSLRFTEIASPTSPSANDALLYAIDRSGTTTLEYKDSAGVVCQLGGRLSARVRLATDHTVANNTVTALPMNTERWDGGGFHDNSTNNTRLTVPIAGLWWVWGNVRWAASTTGSRDARIRLNGTDNVAFFQITNTSTEPTMINLSTLWNAAASDYFELVVQQTSGGSLDVTATTSFSPEFAIQYMGRTT